MTESEIKAKLNKLGIGISNKEVLDDTISFVINSVNRKAIEAAREIILNNSASKSATTAQTIIALPIEVNESTYFFKVVASQEADFIDKGVSGVLNKFNTPYSFKDLRPSRKMATAIKSWIQSAGYTTQGSYDSFAWAISTNVKKRGIEPKNWSQVFEQEYIDEMTRQISIAMRSLVQITFKKIAEKNNGNNNT